ncbi:hypothetical protein ALC57_00222 [Trachymyrmex cornetzi]|uniref:Uncharacterized protein n=1 Tax=Trachymyrmex cornetzi TaxID=471704 RepID=A0A151JSV3_9HYME|nr:hypothetical protein ALC57_00222 [Trachymyrmex cornetzi]
MTKIFAGLKKNYIPLAIICIPVNICLPVLRSVISLGYLNEVSSKKSLPSQQLINCSLLITSLLSQDIILCKTFISLFLKISIGIVKSCKKNFFIIHTCMWEDPVCLQF